MSLFGYNIKSFIRTYVIGNKYLYWRDKNKNEIDFIIEPGEGKLIVLEVESNINKYLKFSKVFVGIYPRSINLCVYFKNKKGKKIDEVIKK